jgi:hypothetical protein
MLRIRLLFLVEVVLMATIPEGDTMRLQVDVSEDIKVRLKVAAAKQNRTMSELAEEALAAYLDKVEKGSK